jgi:WhiB family redox-sensing transcriptional regulator
MDTEEFFPHVSAEGEVPISTRAEVNKSLKVCQSCPVKTECYSYAQYFGHRQGIWGGVLLNKRGPRSRMMSSNA